MTRSVPHYVSPDPVRTADLWDAIQGRPDPGPEKLAYACAGGTLTFDQILATGERLATTFSALDIGDGTIVGLALPNTVEFVPTLLAAFKCSATVALVSHKYRASELQGIQQGIHPTCYVTSRTAGLKLQEELSSIGNVRSVAPDGTDLLLLFPDKPSPNSTTLTDSSLTASSPAPDHAIIKLTSGSTGVPKGIALSPANVLAEATNIVATLGLTSDHQILAPVPLAHSYGFDMGVLSMLWSGASLVARDSFVPRRLLEDMSNRDTTVFLGVPSIYRTLVDIPVSAIPDLTHIRYLLSSTAPLQPELIVAFADKFAVPICQHYGSSETGAATTHSPSAVIDHLESVGRAMHNVDITVVDDDGNVLPQGREGEIVICSDAVAQGYVMGAPAGPSPFIGDTYRSGDIGFIDQDEFVHLTGRKGQVINVGGLKVSPNEVVQVLERFPPIREAAVVGIRGANNDEIVCAVVTLREPTNQAAILAHCRDNLADYKVPRRIEFRDALPRSATGKVKLTTADLRL